MSGNANRCIFTGCLVETPTIKRSQNGHTYTRFSIGNNIDVYDAKTKKYHSKTNFIRCIAFGEMARYIVDNTNKGTKICIECIYEQSMYRDSRGRAQKGHIFRVVDVDVLNIQEEPYSSNNWI